MTFGLEAREDTSATKRILRVADMRTITLWWEKQVETTLETQ